MKRGFKAQCERRTVEVRRHLNLSENAPLNAFALADHLKVTVQNAKIVPNVSEHDQNQLMDIDANSWSAFTLKVLNQHLVVYNPSASKSRINSVIMHELSHIMLGHELADGHSVVLDHEATEVIESSNGLFVPSTYDQEQEAEADWLAGALLLPRAALLHIRKNGWNRATASEYYGVSDQMLEWRFRMTGVDIQLGHKTRKAVAT